MSAAAKSASSGLAPAAASSSGELSSTVTPAAVDVHAAGPKCVNPSCHATASGRVVEGTGVVCSECGTLLDANTLSQEVETVQVGDKEMRTGVRVSVHNNSYGVPTDVNSSEHKNRYTSQQTQAVTKGKVMRKVASICSALHLQDVVAKDASSMVEKYTSDKYGTGTGVDLVVAACVYAASRTHKKAVTLMDVADHMQVNVFKLGKVFGRVSETLHLHLEVVEPHLFVPRILTIVNIEDKDKLTRIKKQTGQVLELAKDDWLLVGRIPSAVAAAAVCIALQCNHMEYSVDEMAKQLHIAPRTIRIREKEFLGSFIKLASSLPWAKDITERTISLHLPFIMDNIGMLLDIREANRPKPAGPLGAAPLPAPAVTSAAGTGAGPVAAGDATASSSQSGASQSSASLSSSSSSSSSSSIPSSSSSVVSLKPALSSALSNVGVAKHNDPPSFQRSMQARNTRLMRLKKVIQRIERHSNGAIRISLGGLDLSTLPDSASSVLDEDDLLVEKLLLKGVDARLIADGNVSLHTLSEVQEGDAGMEEELTEKDLPEEELGKYIRTDEEIAVVERMRAVGDVDRAPRPKKKRRIVVLPSDSRSGRDSPAPTS